MCRHIIFLVCAATLMTVFASEPRHCSSFHYEEQLLKKMVQMEFDWSKMKERQEEINSKSTERMGEISTTLESCTNRLLKLENVSKGKQTNIFVKEE